MHTHTYFNKARKEKKHDYDTRSNTKKGNAEQRNTLILLKRTTGSTRNLPSRNRRVFFRIRVKLRTHATAFLSRIDALNPPDSHLFPDSPIVRMLYF